MSWIPPTARVRAGEVCRPAAPPPWTDWQERGEEKTAPSLEIAQAREKRALHQWRRWVGWVSLLLASRDSYAMVDVKKSLLPHDADWFNIPRPVAVLPTQFVIGARIENETDYSVFDVNKRPSVAPSRCDHPPLAQETDSYTQVCRKCGGQWIRRAIKEQMPKTWHRLNLSSTSTLSCECYSHHCFPPRDDWL